MMKATALFSLLIIKLFVINVHAAPPTCLHQGPWSVYTYKKNNLQVAFMNATPKKSEGNYTRRGRTHLLITKHSKTQISLSFVAGYTYKPGSKVLFTIDEKTQFILPTQTTRAWSQNMIQAQALTEALKKGATLKVVGTSKYDTKTTDIFSLNGFTKAFSKLDLQTLEKNHRKSLHTKKAKKALVF